MSWREVHREKSHFCIKIRGQHFTESRLNISALCSRCNSYLKPEYPATEMLEMKVLPLKREFWHEETKNFLQLVWFGSIIAMIRKAKEDRENDTKRRKGKVQEYLCYLVRGFTRGQPSGVVVKSACSASVVWGSQVRILGADLHTGGSSGRVVVTSHRELKWLTTKINNYEPGLWAEGKKREEE